jgi:8-oxo-dGTP pyrophosphatase MutT (NUDIX family)
VSSVALQAPAVRLQYGALPWRKVGGKTHILLITSQTTRRWIVPKGWPIPGLRPAECAEHEAIEEAGVSGDIAATPLGSFRYEKHRKSGHPLPCKVELYSLHVLKQRRHWPEKAQRDIRWCSVAEAQALVGDPGLSRLIAKFAKLQDTPTRELHATSA